MANTASFTSNFLSSTTSAWHLLSEPFERPPLKEDISVEVVIVGGGITGTSLTSNLAKSGIDVALLEAEQLASKASGRNGGLFSTGFEADESELRERIGKDAVEKITQESERSLDEIHHFCLEHKLPAQRLPVHLFELQELDPRETKTLGPKGLKIKRTFAGLHTNPTALVRALGKEAVQRGAKIFGNTIVSGWKRQGQKIVVGTTDGVNIHCSQLVLATNGYTPHLITVPIVSVRNQVFATAPHRKILDALYYDGWLYLVQTLSGELVCGGGRNLDLDRETTSEDGLNPKIQEYLGSFLSERVLQTKPISRWSGILGMTKDYLPLVGQLEERIHITAGFSGHGLVLGWTVGREYAKLLQGDSTAMDMRVFSPFRDSL